MQIIQELVQQVDVTRILWWRMYYPSQDGYREGGSPLSSVPPTQYIPGLGVEKGGANRIADTMCPVRPGSRPNCAGSCGGGCTTKVKMGTGRVVPPSHRCPPPNNRTRVSRNHVGKEKYCCCILFAPHQNLTAISQLFLPFFIKKKYILDQCQWMVTRTPLARCEETPGP